MSLSADFWISQSLPPLEFQIHHAQTTASPIRAFSHSCLHSKIAILLITMPRGSKSPSFPNPTLCRALCRALHPTAARRQGLMPASLGFLPASLGFLPPHSPYNTCFCSPLFSTAHNLVWHYKLACTPNLKTHRATLL